MQVQMIYLQVQKFLSEYLFAIFKQAQLKGVEINLQYPFNITFKECKLFIDAVLNLHE